MRDSPEASAYAERRRQALEHARQVFWCSVRARLYDLVGHPEHARNEALDAADHARRVVELSRD